MLHGVLIYFPDQSGREKLFDNLFTILGIFTLPTTKLEPTQNSIKNVKNSAACTVDQDATIGVTVYVKEAGRSFEDFYASMNAEVHSSTEYLCEEALRARSSRSGQCYRITWIGLLIRLSSSCC